MPHQSGRASYRGKPGHPGKGAAVVPGSTPKEMPPKAMKPPPKAMMPKAMMPPLPAQASPTAREKRFGGRASPRTAPARRGR